MKKLLFVFVCAFALMSAGKLQAQDIHIENNSSCTLTVWVHYGLGQTCTGYSMYVLPPNSYVDGGSAPGCFARAFSVADQIDMYTVYPNGLPTSRSLCSTTLYLSGDANSFIIDP